MEGRNEVFQRLKPPCVALSQEALLLNSPNGKVHTLTARLEELRDTLAAVTIRSNSLDDKLADYVFFPLSQVLKFSQKVSVRCLELTFQCLAVLIHQGWRSRLQPQLAGQIVILCTLMAEKKPHGLASTQTTDELQASAFTCLHHLFDVLDASSEATKSLVAETNVPQLGQTISTILDGIVEGSSPEGQIAATDALHSLMAHVATRDIKAGFLPGIVSKLTRVLVPQTKQRRTHTVLIGALDVLRGLFVSTLGHAPSSTSSLQADSKTDDSSQLANSGVINDEWLETAAIQLKPAVESITRLRSSSRDDVKEALARFCFVILKESRTDLQNCAPNALETLLYLSSEQSGDAIKFQLEMLVMADQALSGLLQSTLHGSLQFLPTQMQSSDEQAKLQRILQISTSYGIVAASGTDISIIDHMLAGTLRDGVVVTLQLSGPKETALNTAPVQSLDLAMIHRAETTTQFTSPLVRYRGQEDLLGAIQGFAITASTTANSSYFVADLARDLRQSQGEMQIATFWLLLDCTEAMFQQHSGVNAFLNLEGDSSGTYREHLEDLYSFSLEILTETTKEEPIDPRFQALALRAIALKAKEAGKEFRYELIDALYPVLHTLATPDESLQRDSITALNIITHSCGYGSVRDLIVENVDYLTNAVALKFNTHDVSPQGPQVLLMMVRLAGSGLLPYLEDTIGSIFAALEDYHGYPLLVELLFQVLGVVAEEGAKAPLLAITDSTRAELRRISDDGWHATTISSLVDLLRERKDEVDQQHSQEKLEAHPKRPWKQADDVENSERDDDDDAQEDQQMVDADPPPPAPKTYGLLLKISELTQHFLPSASASLRMSLLALIKTTVPAIARHENSFLPLINTLWPEVVSRLDDPEPQVLATALDIIALLCDYAGDFMRSRVLQLWPALLEIHQKTTTEILQRAKPSTMKQKEQKQILVKCYSGEGDLLKKAIRQMQSNPEDSFYFSDTSTRLVWGALVRMIISVVRNVGITPERFDEVIEMLGPVIGEEEVRVALEGVNADAVWLAGVQNGSCGLPMAPEGDGGGRWRFAEIGV